MGLTASNCICCILPNPFCVCYNLCVSCFTTHRLKTLDLEGITQYLEKIEDRRNEPPKVVVMVGAGISVSAGIPDFRSLSTGIYSQMEKYRYEPRFLLPCS